MLERLQLWQKASKRSRFGFIRIKHLRKPLPKRLLQWRRHQVVLHQGLHCHQVGCASHTKGIFIIGTQQQMKWYGSILVDRRR